MTADAKPHLTEHHQDDDLAQYRETCGLAVVGLILGLLSIAALVDPLAWLLPVAGLVVSWLALRKVTQAAPVLAGRKAALLGLIFSILFGAAGVADYVTYRNLVRRQGQRFAKEWFDLLAARRPQEAYQLAMSPADRHPLDEQLWQFYRDAPRNHRELLNFVEQRLVRTLIALGPNALVSYYGTDGQTSGGERDTVYQRFAVTFDDAGQRKTFFVGLTLYRHHLEDGQTVWQVADTQTDFDENDS